MKISSDYCQPKPLLKDQCGFYKLLVQCTLLHKNYNSTSVFNNHYSFIIFTLARPKILPENSACTSVNVCIVEVRKHWL